jgi:pyrimidine deaminase RibD-like protein
MKAFEFTKQDYTIYNHQKLDQYLVNLCKLIINGKNTDPDQYGMVAACVLDPDNNVVYGINSAAEHGQRQHAERVAMNRYEDQYGEIPKGSIIITTLSPCNEYGTHMADERYGESCTDLINSSNVRKVYCGYQDPSQDNEHNDFTLEQTSNSDVKKLCKKFANTFLKKDTDHNFVKDRDSQDLEERRKKKRKPQWAAYGPGLYGGYGYYAGYSGDSGSEGGDGGGDGGGESIENENAMMGKIEDGGKIVRILKKAHTVPFSDEKNWLLIDTDPAKGNKGLGLKWVPADTRFEWVRPYRDTVDENFADGKNPQDKGDSARLGIPKHASLAQLDKIGQGSGRKAQLARWQSNMRRGRAKK